MVIPVSAVPPFDKFDVFTFASEGEEILEENQALGKYRTVVPLDAHFFVKFTR